jgi:hypothetical protein
MTQTLIIVFMYYSFGIASFGLYGLCSIKAAIYFQALFLYDFVFYLVVYYLVGDAIQVISSLDFLNT